MDAQSLRSVIKSARDLMRKDAGLNTDVDRIPQLAWMLFLKCFDDFEQKRAALDKKYKQAIPEGYRWNDWGKNTKLTGSDLIKFVNDDLFPKFVDDLVKLLYLEIYETNDNHIMVDVGANKGVVSNILLNYVNTSNGKIIAVDAHPN